MAVPNELIQKNKRLTFLEKVDERLITKDYTLILHGNLYSWV